MKGINETTVLCLFDAMNFALRDESEAHNANGSEMLSAVFTLTRVVIQASINLGQNPAELRHGVEQLLLECAERKGN